MSDFSNNENRVICKSCGGENKAGNTFCMNCGERIEQGAPGIERPEAEVVQSTPWYNQGNESNPYQNTGTGYTAPPVYSNNVNVNVNQNNTSSGLAIASLVCGIISFFCCYFSFFVSGAGLITGIISLVKKHNGRGMAIAGIVLSSMSIVFWVVVILLAVIGFLAEPSLWYEFSDFSSF